MCRSVPQSPTAATRNRTSRGPGCGRGTSRTSIRPTPTNTAARIPVPTAAVSRLTPCPISAQPLPRGAEPVDTELHDVPVGEVARWALAEAHTGGRARGNDVAG